MGGAPLTAVDVRVGPEELGDRLLEQNRPELSLCGQVIVSGFDGWRIELWLATAPPSAE
jgi:hypothetical protein